MKLTVFDLETTGVDPEMARIVTAYAGYLDDAGNVLEEVQLLVTPDGFQIPEASTAVHGITHDHASEHGVPLGSALTALAAFFASHDGAPVAGHNISYDLTVLDREARRADAASAAIASMLPGLLCLDSLVLDKQLDKFRRGKRTLTTTAAHYGVPLTADDAHNAAADAIASGRITQKLLPHPLLAGKPLEQVHAQQIVWRAAQSASLQEYLRQKGDATAVVDGAWPIRP